MDSYIEEFQKQSRDKNSETVITIDGFAGAGKGTLAKQIAELLDLKHFSASDVFYQVAEERGLEDHELSEEAEKKIDLEIDRKTLERALNNSCVIDSRIASWVLGDYSDLKIRLEASPKERAKRIAEREETSVEKAEEIIEKRDKEDSKRYKKYYNLDLSDKTIYDLLIDNTDLSVKEQEKMVKEALKKKFPEKIK